MKRSASLSQRLNAITEEVEMPSTPVRQRFEVHVATSGAERIAAARLVAQAYVQEGYLTKDGEEALQPFLTAHHLLKETTVFIVKDGERVMGTVALTLDSPAGLPMEDLYGTEVKALRQEGRRLCEICSLAIDVEMGRQSTGMVLELFKAASTYAFCIAKIDDLCLTIKPSHARFYSRIWCEEFGGFKLDERFAFAETLAMRLRREMVELVSSNGKTDRKRVGMARALSFLSYPEQARLSAELVASMPASREVLDSISCLPEILGRATPEQIAYLWQTNNRRSRPSAEFVHQNAARLALVSC